MSALLGDDEVAATVAPLAVPAPPAAAAAAGRTPFTLPIAELRPGKFQPRTRFEGLEALVESVRQHGLLQPILVRPLPGEARAYEIVAGERRWRAAQKAQLHEVPVVVRGLDDLDALQLALVENLQRADLSAIDEAAGYRRLMSEFGQTQEEVAESVGKSRPHVANTLRLLELPESVRGLVQDGTLSAGQARSLLAFADPAAMAERCKNASSLSIARATASAKDASSAISTDCDEGSCSACDSRSAAIQAGSFWRSATTRISEGPAIRSMPT